MKKLILEALKEQKIEKYCIFEKNSESVELFFIKKRMDLCRSKQAKRVRLTIYRDFEENGCKYTGSADVYVFPEMDKEKVSALIMEGYDSAGYVKNPYFELVQGQKEDLSVMESSLCKNSLMDDSVRMSEAFYKADSLEGAFVNSSEFFANKETVSVINSAGCDVEYIKYYFDGEFVVQSRENNNDVEFYNQFSYDNLETEAIYRKCLEALETVRDRAFAKKAPDNLENIPIILYGSTMPEFLSYYLTKANASMVYPSYSPYAKDYVIQKDVQGELLNITLKADVPYSADGVKKSDHVLIKDGVVCTLHGRVNYSSYVGTEQIGNYTKFECDNGSASLEELKQGPYILVRNFSDFQMDAFDGHFGGEFRLAYYFDGKEMNILTGGTVTGNIFDAEKNMIFSRERYSQGDYTGPLAVKIM